MHSRWNAIPFGGCEVSSRYDEKWVGYRQKTADKRMRWLFFTVVSARFFHAECRFARSACSSVIICARATEKATTTHKLWVCPKGYYTSSNCLRKSDECVLYVRNVIWYAMVLVTYCGRERQCQKNLEDEILGSTSVVSHLVECYDASLCRFLAEFSVFSCSSNFCSYRNRKRPHGLCGDANPVLNDFAANQEFHFKLN